MWGAVTHGDHGHGHPFPGAAVGPSVHPGAAVSPSVHAKLKECMRQVAAAEQMLASTRGSLTEIYGDMAPGLKPGSPPSPRGSPMSPLSARGGELVKQPSGNNLAPPAVPTTPTGLGKRKMGGVGHHVAAEVPSFATPYANTAFASESAGSVKAVSKSACTSPSGLQSRKEARDHGYLDQMTMEMMGVKVETPTFEVPNLYQRSLTRSGTSGIIDKLNHKLHGRASEGPQQLKISGMVSNTPVEANKRATVDLKARQGLWHHVGWRIWLPVLHPESQRRIAWTMIGLVFIIIECYTIPYELAFGSSGKGAMFIMSSIITGYFIMDVGVSFVTAYIDENAALVVDLRLIASNYLRHWFVLDVIASIPWDWLPEQTSGASLTRGTKALRFIRILRILRLSRLLRLAKLKAIVETVETFIESNPLLVFYAHLVRLLFALSTLVHWAGCGWYAVGVHFGSPSWIEDPVLEGSGKTEAYVWAVYFATATMTTVGYGDISPMKSEEALYVLLLLLIACVVFTMLMGTLADMITSLNAQQHVIAEKKTMLMRYMRWRMVPRSLALGIRQHLLFIWDTYQGYDTYEEQMKLQLPPVLRANLAYHVYGKVINSLPFFSWMTDFNACTRELSVKIHSMFLEAGDNLFTLGQVNDQIYVLLTGRVWLSPNRNLAHSTTLGLGGMSPLDSSGLELYLPRVAGQNYDDLNGDTSETTPEPGHRESISSIHALGSDVMEAAARELRAEDLRKHHAAKVLQRAFRRGAIRSSLRTSTKALRRLASLQTAGGVDHLEQTQSVREQRSMASKFASAPAYFGESCLWLPLDQWSTGPQLQYAYTARCETRGELVNIPRQAVKEVIDQFSPIMPERFEYFRQSVTSNLILRLPNAARRASCDSCDEAENGLSNKGSSVASVPSVKVVPSLEEAIRPPVEPPNSNTATPMREFSRNSSKDSKVSSRCAPQIQVPPASKRPQEHDARNGQEAHFLQQPGQPDDVNGDPPRQPSC